MGSNTATTETWLAGASISALSPPPISFGEQAELFPYVEAFSRTAVVKSHPRYEALREQAENPPERPLLTIADVRNRLGQ
jgi:hypothetical protein